MKRKYAREQNVHVPAPRFPLFVPKPGHEKCGTCNDCGLPLCPDCDANGNYCTMHHFFDEDDHF